ncbi:hypothetical protein BDD12DRAFT_908714 [Trichophaea hybrida]|nr:hypothetical protein BDD12DRAFT_908714 [Trichophaea hybrida]
MHIATGLFPNPEVAAAITDYATAHSTDLGEVVNKHYNDNLEFCEHEGLSPSMMISPNQAQFMVFLAKLY